MAKIMMTTGAPPSTGGGGSKKSRKYKIKRLKVNPKYYATCAKGAVSHAKRNAKRAKGDKTKIPKQLGMCAGAKSEHYYGFGRKVGTSGYNLVRHRGVKPFKNRKK
jgi:hypothetical protein